MENKKRLIDAEAVLAGLQYISMFGDVNDNMIQGAMRLARSKIENAPTVDAVEVVHGRWEDEHGGKYANPRYRCSVCKERALYNFERDLLDNWKEVQALTPHCPFCTAKLDGGKGNDI